MNYIIIIIIVLIVILLLLSISAYFVMNSKPVTTPTTQPPTTQPPSDNQQNEYDYGGTLKDDDYQYIITAPPKPTYIQRTTPPPGTEGTIRPKVTVPPTPPVTERLPDSIKDLNTKFAWRSMQNAGERDLTELAFLKTCTKPWDAMYRIGCTIDGITYRSNVFGPVSDGTKQAPRLRIGDYGGDNLCTKNNGILAVYRQRPADPDMIDVTQFLKDSTGSTMYNRKDALVVDDYLGDC